MAKSSSSSASSAASSSSSSLKLSSTVKSNETLRLVLTAMHDIAPLALADHSFDNVGLLLEAPKPRKGNGVLLCIDLTTPVFKEAQEDQDISTIICYHPIIFRGLKSLTQSNSQQQTLLQCASEGISIYSPHTSLDATPGGINDWLAAGCARFAGFKESPTPLQPSAVSLDGYENAGMGRKFTLAEPIALNRLIERLKAHLSINHLQVALPSQSASSSSLEETTISSIAVCAGSGGSVLSRDSSDLWLTGELSHHEILAATAVGRVVILTNHSNSERGFLEDRLKPALEESVGGSGKLKVVVSQADKDPLVVV